MKTYLPMPTVDQLLQVFKDRGWKPAPVRGCWLKHVKEGCCCALPALVALGDPEFFSEFLNQDPLDHTSKFLDIYERADEIYGPGARNIYCGFDANGQYKGPWYRLGHELRQKLGVTRDDH